MKANVIVIDGESAGDKSYTAKRIKSETGGEAWEYVRDGETCHVMIRAGDKRVVFKGRRLILVLDGDVLACEWERSGYGPEFVSQMLEGSVIEDEMKAFKHTFPWKKALLIAGIAIAVFIGWKVIGGALSPDNPEVEEVPQQQVVEVEKEQGEIVENVEIGKVVKDG